MISKTECRDRLAQAATTLESLAAWQFLKVDMGKAGMTPLEFLTMSGGRESMYYGSRTMGPAVACIGIAARWATMPDDCLPTGSGIRCYACLPFQLDAPPATKWAGVPTGYFIPQFECDSDGGLSCNLVLEPGADAETAISRAVDSFEAISHVAPSRLRDLPPVIDRIDTPTRDEWVASVETVLDLIHRGELQKLVLARETELSFADAPDPLTILAHLMEFSTHGTVFMFRDGPTCFLGASPELLYTRDGAHLASHAIAATRARGDTPEEDDALTQAILSTPKELHEHGLVTDMIVSVLKPLCSALTVSDTAVLKLPHVQHLYRCVEGDLVPGTTDQQILSTLHPTPAVGGTPRDAALAKLQELERFERGCYASPVGFVTRDHAEFHVAIRSALLCGSRLSVFTGAGLVAGSDPALEWAEIEKKMETFTSICNHG